MWAARNTDCHALATKENEPKSIRMKNMHDRVRKMHKEAESITTEDRKLFEIGTKPTPEKRPNHLEKWIIDAGKVPQKAFEDQESLGRHPITDYFPILFTTNNSSNHPTSPPTTLDNDHG